MRKVFLGFAAVQLALVLLQFYLATFGGFEQPPPAVGSEDAAIGWHVMNGFTVIPAVSLLTTIMAALARAPGSVIGYSAAPLGAVALQFLLFMLAEAVGGTMEKTNTASLVVLGFHAIVGLGLLFVAWKSFAGARAHAKAGSRVAV